MAKLIDHLPELDGDEALLVSKILSDLDDDQARSFAGAYRSRRKDPQVMLWLTLIVFLGFGGINRFMLGQVGMGLLYLFTGGLCLIGSIVDIINHKDLTFEYNRKIALEVRNMV